MFQTLDNSINAALEKFDRDLSTLSFENSKTEIFILSEDLNIDFISSDCCGPGVYFFELKSPDDYRFGKKASTILQNIKKYWKHRSVRAMWSPGIKDSRVSVHKEFIDGWIPFYIGKSRYLEKRVREHVFQDRGKTSFGMKLKARKNLYGLEFRISYIKIDVKNYDMIVPYVESAMRNKYNPITGKQ